MARTKEFDPDSALHSAMLAFWRHGYSNTTMEELVAETGVVRASLYATFGNKAELFERAVDHYGAYQRDGVSGARDLRDALERWFENAISGARAGEPRGCLVINSAAEYATLTPELQRLVRAHLDRVRAFFRDCASTLAPDGDADRIANVLMGANASVRLLARAGAPEDQLRDIADDALGRLGASTRRPNARSQRRGHA